MTREVAASNTSTVTIQTSPGGTSGSFSPQSISIHIGDTISWDNPSEKIGGVEQNVNHTTTSDSGQAETWDSNAMPPGGSDFTHQFTHTGTFSYHCSFHSGMTGTVVVQNDNPSVSIASPSSGSTVHGTVHITGTASDADDGVASVKIQIDNGASQDASGTTSWTFDWDTTGLTGSHTVKATATDVNGATGTASATYTVDNDAAPSATISSPAPDANLTRSNISITGTASDPDGASDLSKVEVAIDAGAWQAATGTGTWSFTWDARAASLGEHTIHARATDAAGKTGETQENVNLTNSAISVAITTPAEGATVGRANVSFSGTASDSAGIANVDWRADSGPWRPATGTTSWSFTWDAHGATLGAHTITVRANETGGAQNATAVRHLTVSSANAAPTVTISAPREGAVVNGTVAVAGNASDDGGVALVQVAIDNGPWQNATGNSSWTFTWNATNASLGAHVIHARATETDGALNGTTRVNVTVGSPHVNAPPQIAILTPPSGTTVDKNVTFTGTASDDGNVSEVDWRVHNDANWTKSTGTTNWTFSVDTWHRANGSLTIDVRALESDGPFDASVNRVITVAHAAPPPVIVPSVRITLPSDGAVVHGVIAVAGLATAPNGTLVSILGLNTPIDESGSWSVAWNTSHVSNGSVRLTAQLIEGAKVLASSPPVDVVVANPSTVANPTVTILAPLSGDTVAGDSIVRVKVVDPSGAALNVVVTLDNFTLLSWSNLRGTAFATWASTSTTSGTHTLVAHATRGALSVLSAPVTIIVANAAPTSTTHPTTTTPTASSPPASNSPATTPTPPELALAALGAIAVALRRSSRRTG
ncbi:MAG: Ig-like domain-containing protein [Thermoplasmatota archaeon]